MALTFSTQASIAFKNLSGKSNTDLSKGVNNESEGIFLNIDSNNVWTTQISATPSSITSVLVSADLSLDTSSNGHAYFTTWPSTPPSGTDPVTLSPYAYGSGVLDGITNGDRIDNLIPPSYGVLYEAKPYDTGPTLISPGDARNWIYQYNSGVFYQQDVVGLSPESIDVYFYIGNRLSDGDDQVLSNIRITATGTDNYFGTATPSISTYSITDLYLVDFQNDNTGSTAVTLNINGLGSYEVIKFADVGAISLTSSGDIISGQVYYTIWDGANFQIYDFNPLSSSPTTYTNPSPVPTTIGGIVAGLTFSDTTMKQMWDLLLYPYLQPNFTSFTFNHGGSTREVGNPIVAGTYSFTWNTSYPANITSNSIKIKDISTGLTLITGTANDYSAPLTIATATSTSASSHTWQITALRTNGTVISLNTVVNWRWKIFYGTQSSTSLTASQVQALSTNSLATARTGTYNFGESSYKYFTWPTSFGAPLLFKDGSTNLAVAMAGVDEGYSTAAGAYYSQTVSLTNGYGISTSYYVFRTRNILGASISIVVT